MQPRHPLLCCCCCSRGDALTTDSWIMNRYSYTRPVQLVAQQAEDQTRHCDVIYLDGQARPPPRQAARSLCGEVEATTAMGIVRLLPAHAVLTAMLHGWSQDQCACYCSANATIAWGGLHEGLSQFDDLDSMVVRGIACTVSVFLRKHS